MNSIEDRVHAAMSAAADLAAREIRTAPPLRLPPGPRTRASHRAPRRWIRWAVPLAAATAVAALAVALVVIRDIPNGGVAALPTHTPTPVRTPTPVPDVGGVPAYYAALVNASGAQTTPGQIAIGETRTGKRVATVDPPAGTTFAGITGAADDRTFVVDVQSAGDLGNEGQPWQPRTWYLLRLSPGTAHVAALTRLPVPGTSQDTGVVAISLSPDGSMFAVATQPDPNLEMNPDTPVQLSVYSVATGKALHSWFAPTSATTQFFGSPGGLDASHVLAWTGPQDAPTGLAFGYAQVEPGTSVNGSQVSRPTPFEPQLRYLPLSAPSGTSLLSDSTPVPFDLVSGARPTPASLSCTVHAFFDLLFTGPTGKAGDQSLICAATGSTRAHGQLNAQLCATGPAWAQIGLMKYQLGNGKPSGTLAKYASACTGLLFTVEPLWTNPAGTIQLGFLGLRPGGTDAKPRFGVFENGTFTPLPYPPGKHVSEDLAFFNNIAW